MGPQSFVLSLTEIINSSLESAKYPDAWKFAEVIPLLKEGDHEVASNNRPLSLLAVASSWQTTALTLLNLSKAFDSLNHNKLLVKLSSVGASPHVVNWFKSYLTGRSQSVRINSILSDPLPITHGVPQGAILSPLLFCIYLNDLPLIVPTKPAVTRIT